MERTRGIIVRWLFALALAFAALPSAHASTTACTPVVSLPANLFEPGHYCLDNDFTQSFTTAAIQLFADGIVLDCNGHRIRNTNATNTQSGVGGQDRQGVTIRNCTFDGFYIGIYLYSSNDDFGGNSIEDNVVINSRLTGIFAVGSNNRILRNRVSSVTGNYNGGATGIIVYSATGTGVGNIIRDNVISNFRPVPPPGSSSSPIAINFYYARNTEVTGNIICGIYGTTGQTLFLITSSTATESVVRGNTVLAPPPMLPPYDATQYSAIILFGTPEEQATNVCSENIVGHFDLNITGCVKSANTEF
ncbi:MAG: NosD domain-containing protein [Arenimonas sp.]